MNKQNKIIVFESNAIRRVWRKDEWWFSIVDVVSALTDSLPSSKIYFSASP